MSFLLSSPLQYSHILPFFSQAVVMYNSDRDIMFSTNLDNFELVCFFSPQ